MKAQRRIRRSRMGVLVTSVAAYAIALGVTATHPSAANTGFLLKGQPVPEPSTLGAYVVNRTAAVQLGKALFWDEQAGSDGTQACASCHFNAGADNRVNNTLDPGKDGVFNVTPGANGTTTAADYPFHKLANVNTRTPVLSDKDDVHGSQGVYRRNFISVGSIDVDSCADVSDATFQSGGVNVRRVTGRNTPTTINAVFNFRNFWDGRGREVFNGANPGATPIRTRGSTLPRATAAWYRRPCSSTTPAQRRRRRVPR